ncbi:hypothetical protein NDU88_001316 [Pleurodeles waltl]|uniref:Uncharacterized protein n=1 Tax=Pleurodeles waltl TaxID=8319 RepID=A0AAV7S9S4_PLEWA|nr:hypothetical protein NDU88_001316 [Pleurodeles waltl]
MKWEAFKVIVCGAFIGAVAGARQEVMREITQLENKLGPLETKALTNTNATEELQDARIAYAEQLERLRLID